MNIAMQISTTANSIWSTFNTNAPQLASIISGVVKVASAIFNKCVDIAATHLNKYVLVAISAYALLSLESKNKELKTFVAVVFLVAAYKIW